MENSQVQLLTQIADGILPDDKPSQYEAGLIISNAVDIENRAAEDECRDILEATQIIDGNHLLNFDHREKTRQETIPQVDGAYDSSSSIGEEVDKKRVPVEADLQTENGPTEKMECKDKKTNLSAKEESGSYYVSREDVKKSNIRFSQLRQLLTDREGGSNTAVTSGTDESHINTQLDPEECLQGRTATHTNARDMSHILPDNQTSQEKLFLWREKASQVLFEEESMLHSENSDESGVNDGHTSQGVLNFQHIATNTGSHHHDVARAEAMDKLVTMKPIASPPSRADLHQTWGELGILPIVHESPHFSDPKDIGKRIQVFAGKEFRLTCSAVQELPAFSYENHFQRAMDMFPSCNEKDTLIVFAPIRTPPSRINVDKWLRSSAGALKNSLARGFHGSQQNVMDPNTGKMIPAPTATQVSAYSLMVSPDIPSVKNILSGYTEDCTPAPRTESGTPQNEGYQGVGSMRPASPKYDEVESFYKDPIIMEDNLVSRRGKVSSPGGHTIRSAERLSGKNSLSRITPPTEMHAKTPDSQLGFKSTSPDKGEGVTLASIEIHAANRQNLLPDPKYDSVGAIVITVFEDDEVVEGGQYHSRVLVYDSTYFTNHNDRSDGLTDVQIEAYKSEELLFEAFVSAIRYLDPDILMGFEIQNESLGYLAERAYYAFDNKSFLSAISRTPDHKEDFDEMKEHDQYGWQTSSGLQVPGRIVLNLWRIMKAGNLI